MPNSNASFASREDPVNAPQLVVSYAPANLTSTFAASADTSGLSKIPALAIVCQNPGGNILQRQLVAAGLKNVKGATLDGCAHWIYEENPEETLAVITDFLGAANALPKQEQ